MQVYGQMGVHKFPAALCVSQAGLSPSPACPLPSACPKAHAKSWGWSSLLLCPLLLWGDGLEQSHTSSSPAPWDVDADCPIPVSGWAGVPKYPKIMLASGNKLCCLIMSDGGRLAGVRQGAILVSISGVCRVNDSTGHMQTPNMHLRVSDPALTADRCGSRSSQGCRGGCCPTHP